MLRFFALALFALLPSCASAPPARFVLERDVGDWRYRVYQRVLDVEIAIEGNPAVGHTATYVRRPDGRSSAVPFANVFVSVYERPDGLAAEVHRQVRALGSYEPSVRAIGGGYAHYLDGGPGDRWALWVSSRYVVKIGGEVEELPADIVATYMSIYPSDLDPHGRARPGALSAGEPVPAQESTGDQDVPDSLQENAPR
jgi:hypothetical protein